MTYEDCGFEHWDAHDYGEYDPGPDDDGDANWYAEEGERFMRAEVLRAVGEEAARWH